jgi:NAD(P)-dependent dehydrogenase (short-subunit alcohol dehydrogenase family)
MNVIVTGASGGIGYHTALHLAGAGHTVFAVARRKAQLEKLKDAANRLHGAASLHVLAGDILSDAFLDDLAREISERAGFVNILINIAGTLVNKRFEALTAGDWQDVYKTNVFAIVELVRKLLPLFQETVKNHIINISSMGGFQGSAKFPGLSAYSSSKAALAGLTECLAEEFKDRNIAVNCLCLGSVQTEMFSNAFPDYKAATTADEAGKFIAEFAVEGAKLFNGKVIPVSSSTP